MTFQSINQSIRFYFRQQTSIVNKSKKYQKIHT